LSDECVTFLESLSRPLSQEKSATAIHLFAKNLEADMYNFVKLGELPGFNIMTSEVQYLQAFCTGGPAYSNT
jgi:hypothetical protein